MFYQARLVIKSNKKTKSGKTKNPLSGYLVCGCCGHKLTKGRTTNKNWLCATARYTDDTECGCIRLNEAAMKEKLLSAIRLQCKVADASLESARSQQNKEVAVLDALKWDLRKLERTLDEGKDELMSIMDAYYDGKITKEIFMEQKLHIKNKEEELSQKIEETKAQMAAVKKKISDQLASESDAGRIVKHQDVTELDEGIMNELVNRIIVYPNNAVHIEWNFVL